MSKEIKHRQRQPMIRINAEGYPETYDIAYNEISILNGELEKDEFKLEDWLVINYTEEEIDALSGLVMLVEWR